MKAHDTRIAWYLRLFVTWPLEIPVLNKSEREVDLVTGSAAPNGEVVGETERVNGIGIDEGEIVTDAIQQDAMMKIWLSTPLPLGDNRPWEMLLVFTRGHIIPVKDFTLQ